MDAASYWQPLLGGTLIGLSAATLFWLNGRLFGVSTLLAGVIKPAPGDVLWRVLALLGLLLAGLVGMAIAPEQIGRSPRPLGLLVLAGLCVGIGTRIGSGCTSGHGVCGVGRLSPRSLIATSTFVGMGVLTVLVLRSLGGVP